jgi:hypothetical protein
MNIPMLKQVKNLLKLDRQAEDVHDFLGVVQIDVRHDTLVLGDHIAAILEVSGTDYLHASGLREAIRETWKNTLNSVNMDVQCFFDRRPISWDLPGGHLDIISRQTNAYTKDEDSWEQQSLARYKEAILSGQLETNQPVNELRQYIVLRYPMGTAENVRMDDERVMYLPPKTSLRFWEQAQVMFSGRRGRVAWEARANRACQKLDEQVRIFRSRIDVPGLSIKRLESIEITRCLHLLWLEEEAYTPGAWIKDEEMLREIVSGADNEQSQALSMIEADRLIPEPKVK